jgi:pimeloyl-ACP methyl ester carboxylesterase
MPYVTSHALSEPNRQITRLLFSIHSSGFDALEYYENARLAASSVRGALPETLIIAPQFFEEKAIPGAIPNGLLYWRVSPFRGSSRGAIGSGGKQVKISAFEVMDDWLTSLTDRRLFPRIKDVVLFGHSGGGQFVQRYAMVGKYEPPNRIKCRYVVSAPSSYAYASGERFDPGVNRFRVPEGNALSACPDYNNWGYGLDSPYVYFSDVDAEAIARRYAERFVFYVCGANDNDPNDDTIGKSCGAMMQGRHRLERMQVFAAYLRHKYGASITRRHSFAVVPGVGHYGRGTMTSASGRKFLFSPIR